MKKALLLSFLFHALAIAAALFFHTQGSLELREAHDEYEVAAPLGQVFVQEASLHRTEKEHVSQEKALELPGEMLPEVAPRADTSAEAPESFGVPGGEAEPLGQIQPEYPPLSRRLGEEGEAVFVLTIRQDGFVEKAELEKSSGFGRLDQAARNALMAAQFRSPPAGQQASPTLKRFRVEFRLETDSKH